jgi:anti-anti-sigma factor
MADESLEIEPVAPSGSGEHLVVELQLREGEHTLVLAGELDVSCAQAFEASVRDVCDRRPETLVLDLSELAFMDSSGLRVVLLTRELCEGLDIAFAIVPGMPQVQRLFEVIGLLELLPFRAASADASENSV